MKEIKIAVTGHRSERIEGQEKKIGVWLAQKIQDFVSKYDKVILIDGMADGVDELAALIALQYGGELSCYFPYRKKLYGVQKYLTENAAEVRYVCDEYQNGCYFKRDRRMVDDCDLLLVVWDGNNWGGTYYTYEYALEKGKKMIFYPWHKEQNDWDSIEQGYNDFVSKNEDSDNVETGWD